MLQKVTTFTPRVRRNTIRSFFPQHPKLSKVFWFIASYSYKALKEGKYKSCSETLYKGIEISLFDCRRWLGRHRDRQEAKLNELKKTLKENVFDFQFTEKALLVDLKILVNEEINYIAELTKDEAKLNNGQILLLKQIQVGSRRSQIFNLSTLIQYRNEGDKRERRIKQKVLDDLKHFEEMKVLKKVEFLQGGKQVKLVLWREQKSGVGKRLKKKQRVENE